MLSQIRPALILLLLMTALTGILYPLAMMGLAQLLWPANAHGSLIERDGTTVGSRLIGQSFTSAAYFHSRPSAAGSGYDGAASSGTNLGPTSRALLDAIHERVAAARAHGGTGPVPADLVTSSGSGLDPHLSVAATEWQIERVAHERGVPAASIRELVAAHVEDRQLGFLGAPRLNILLLNLDLDEKFPRAAR
jgi:potassium-transporting ATPase KdpC subunit